MTETQTLRLHLLDKMGYDISKAREAYKFVTEQDGNIIMQVNDVNNLDMGDGVYLHYADHHEEFFDDFNDKTGVIGITVRLGEYSATLDLFDVIGCHTLLPGEGNGKVEGDQQFYEAMSLWNGLAYTASLYERGCVVPIDRTNRYIPSLRELFLFVEFLPEVRKALSYAGGEDFRSGSSYWTSTDNNGIGAWIIDFPSGYVPGWARYSCSEYRVRPCLFVPDSIELTCQKQDKQER